MREANSERARAMNSDEERQTGRERTKVNYYSEMARKFWWSEEEEELLVGEEEGINSCCN
jgi:hypothetical protein